MDERIEQPVIKAKRAKLLHVVAGEIGADVVSGRLPVGELIPPEPELCGRFGVSRTVIREAVQLLSSKGLLRTRPGIGTWVPPVTEWSFWDPLVLAWVQESHQSELVLDHLFRFRSAIEPAAAAEAASNATEPQLAALASALDIMRGASVDFDAWIMGDIEFHTAIYVASNNVFMAPLATLFRQYFTMSFRVSSSNLNHQHCLQEHVDVYDAIVRSDPDGARRAVHVLLNNATEDVRSVRQKTDIPN